MEKETFKDAKVGDRVWDMRFGWGVIVSDTHTKESPLYIKFDSSHAKHYNLQGIHYYFNTIQTLFWDEFEIPKEAYVKPLPKLEVDTKVIVWNNDFSLKQRRHFSHFDSNGKMFCFNEGTTSFTAVTSSSYTPTSRWENYEIYSERETR